MKKIFLQFLVILWINSSYAHITPSGTTGIIGGGWNSPKLLQTEVPDWAKSRWKNPPAVGVGGYIKSEWGNGSSWTSTTLIVCVSGLPISCPDDMQNVTFQTPQIYLFPWILIRDTCPENSYIKGDYQCVCNPGYAEDDAQLSCLPITISIEGASSTMALPSVIGPIIQTVKTKKGDAPLPNYQIEFYLKNLITNQLVSTRRNTDENGEYAFTYVPPYFSTQIEMNAKCSNCLNEAFKQIVVLSGNFQLDHPSEQDSQMCWRH
ncbi:carboxypeptidase-like regulatory domain-containing protein [Comamonas piscis]